MFTVYINGKEAKRQKIGNACQAKLGKDSKHFSLNPGGSVPATWTGRHGVNGICGVDE